MNNANRNRNYRSPIRERRARETRHRIVGAARKLFSEQGYGATTVQMIADQAGVALQTIYASVGSKRQILSALLDEIEEEAHLGQITPEIEQAEDPREQIRLQVTFGRQLFEDGFDVINTLQGAGTIEPDMAAAYHEGNQRHLASQRRLTTSWDTRGLLREGLDHRLAADILATLTSFESYCWLTIECGWDGAQYEQWLIDTIPGLLLRPEL